MPYENFLINEPKRLRSKRFRRNLIGEELLILGNPRRKKGLRAHRNIAMGFHDSMGTFHPIRASADYSPSRTGESRMMKKRPKVKRKYGTKPKFKRKPFKRKTVKKAIKAIRKEVKEMAKRRKKAVKRNEPRRRKKGFRRNEPRRRKKGFRRNEPRKSRRSYRRNEPRKRKKGFRRNPATATSMIKEFSPSKIMSIAPYFITGAASMIATAKVPTLIGAGDSMLWKYGSQLVTAIGGGILVGRFFGKTHGFVWAAVGGSVVAADLISNYVLKQVGISGLAEDLIETQSYAEVGAYPYAEIAGYPYAEVGAYPYMDQYAY